MIGSVGLHKENGVDAKRNTEKAKERAFGGLRSKLAKYFLAASIAATVGCSNTTLDTYYPVPGPRSGTESVDSGVGSDASVNRGDTGIERDDSGTESGDSGGIAGMGGTGGRNADAAIDANVDAAEAGAGGTGGEAGVGGAGGASGTGGSGGTGGASGTGGVSGTGGTGGEAGVGGAGGASGTGGSGGTGGASGTGGTGGSGGVACAKAAPGTFNGRIMWGTTQTINDGYGFTYNGASTDGGTNDARITISCDGHETFPETVYPKGLETIKVTVDGYRIRLTPTKVYGPSVTIDITVEAL